MERLWLSYARVILRLDGGWVGITLWTISERSTARLCVKIRFVTKVHADCEVVVLVSRVAAAVDAAVAVDDADAIAVIVDEVLFEYLKSSNTVFRRVFNTVVVARIHSPQHSMYLETSADELVAAVEVVVMVPIAAVVGCVVGCKDNWFG